MPALAPSLGAYPTFRFFSTQGKAPLSVDVIYPALGTKDAGWRLVQLRYVADNALKGDWLVDDVLIDPRMR